MYDAAIPARRITDAVSMVPAGAKAYARIDGNKNVYLEVRSVFLDPEGDLILDIAHPRDGQVYPNLIEGLP